MITTFLVFFYTLSSLIVMLLLSIVLQKDSNYGYAIFFGVFALPVSILLGVVMVTCSLLEKHYPSEFIFELNGLLILFIILTPLSSYIILTIKNVHENELYSIPFCISAFISFTPAILKMFLLMQESTEKQFLTSKTAFFAAATLYLSTMIGMFFVPNE